MAKIIKSGEASVHGKEILNGATTSELPTEYGYGIKKNEKQGAEDFVNRLRSVLKRRENGLCRKPNVADEIC